MKDRLKRILAFVIDWNIALLPAILAAPFIMNISQQHPAAGLLLFPLILAALAVFVLRDVIFRGRSLGKRIMGAAYLQPQHNGSSQHQAARHPEPVLFPVPL